MTASSRTSTWDLLLVAAFVGCAAVATAHVSGWIPASTAGRAARPLATLLLLVHAFRRGSADGARRRWILAGLALSVAGEWLISAPGQSKVGLWCFAAVQLCYLAALRVALGPLRIGWPLLLHGLIVGGLVAIWSRGDAPLLPVAVFLCLLGLLASQSEAWWLRERHRQDEPLARRATLGALWWIVADAIWTVSLHVAWVPGTYVWVLAAYWYAQWNLAALAGGPVPAAGAARASSREDVAAPALRVGGRART